MKQIISMLVLILVVLSSAGCIEFDTDNDGYSNDVDAFPSDSRYHLDSDGDGSPDEIDVFPHNSKYVTESDRLDDINDPHKLTEIGINFYKDAREGPNYLDPESYVEADMYLSKSLSIEPDDRTTYIYQMRTDFRLGNYEKLENEADALLEKNENDKDGLLWKSVALGSLNDLEGATYYVNKALEIDPDFEEALLVLEALDDLTPPQKKTSTSSSGSSTSYYSDSYYPDGYYYSDGDYTYYEDPNTGGYSEGYFDEYGNYHLDVYVDGAEYHSVASTTSDGGVYVESSLSDGYGTTYDDYYYSDSYYYDDYYYSDSYYYDDYY